MIHICERPVKPPNWSCPEFNLIMFGSINYNVEDYKQKFEMAKKGDCPFKLVCKLYLRALKERNKPQQLFLFPI